MRRPWMRWMGSLLLAAACAPKPAVLPEPEPIPAPPAEPRVEVPPCEHIARIEVHKSEHRLTAFCERGAVVAFPVALGREDGPKLRAGDQRTPEGDYRISGPARASRFHLFIPIDYPSAADVERAHREGVLTDDAYREILEAVRSGSTPPPLPLGSGLGLHGEGERWQGDSPYIDWTNGCIALADEDLDFLVARLRPGTPVRVLP